MEMETVEPASVLTIPTDSRAVVRAQKPPVPISGGTLLASSDGTRAFVADSDRDRVSVVDVATQRVLQHVALDPGDEPGRLVQDDVGRVHVVLRGAGAVATLDAVSFQLLAKRAVCAAPRGIAFEAASQTLLVACSGGDLVSLPAAEGGVGVRVHLGGDLRDVVPRADGGYYVSRAKSAELLTLDAAHTLRGSARPITAQLPLPGRDGTKVMDTLSPELARRTLALRGGGAMMLHQGARDGAIPLGDPHAPDPNASPYGGGSDGDPIGCAGVVGSEITLFDDGDRPPLTGRIQDVLAVDIAESPEGEMVVASAGPPDPDAPAVRVMLPPPLMPQQLNVVSWYDRNVWESAYSMQLPLEKTCWAPTDVRQLPAPVTALAFLPDGRLLAQSREPATLWILPSFAHLRDAPLAIALGGASVLDTGHELFHRDAGAGVACASCHLEGGDDGHVWQFLDRGPRRTQALNVGLEGTAPFHWVGDMSDIATLMENVFVGRMGGVHQSPERTRALEQWLYALPRPAPQRDPNDAAAVRGKALFEGEAQCSKCHDGPKLTDNRTLDVGTGLSLQVPSLIGVVYRSPWLHDGCATSLRQRFDPSCGGGDQHGQTSQLDSDQLDDLVAYLESL